MSIAERALTVLQSVAETDVVRSDQEIGLYEHQILDSFKTVELIVAFSREFDIDISPAEFDRDEWATPRKVIAYLEAKVAAS
jgi:D-alanine--poly(phosphoribitol) ligase subunit 2